MVVRKAGRLEIAFSVHNTKNDSLTSTSRSPEQLVAPLRAGMLEVAPPEYQWPGALG